MVFHAFLKLGSFSSLGFYHLPSKQGLPTALRPSFSSGRFSLQLLLQVLIVLIFPHAFGVSRFSPSLER